MKNKNLITGLAIGAGLLAAAYLVRNRRSLSLSSMADEASHLFERIRNRFGADPASDGASGFGSAHDGQHLANKIRHKVARMV